MDVLDAVDHVSVPRVGELPEPALPGRASRSDRPSSPRTSPPAPERERTAVEREPGASMPLVLMASLGAHVLFGVALAALPVAASLASHEPQMVELEVAPLPVPEPIAEPDPIAEPIAEPEPELVPEPEPVRAPRPERVAAAPAPAPEPPPPAAAEPPPPSSAPPSLDDVFGEPPPPLPSLTAAGGSGFAVAAGSADGAAGGVPGGRGRTVGATSRAGTGEGTGAGTGPSADEIRRARRAYAERVRELLSRLARYPVPARRSGLEGRVVVALRIATDGRLLGARVSSSCGYSMLDEAALTAANDLRQVPAPPELSSWDNGDELRVPIVFELTR